MGARSELGAEADLGASPELGARSGLGAEADTETETATDLSRIAETEKPPPRLVQNRFPGSLDRKIGAGATSSGLKIVEPRTQLSEDTR